MRIKDNHFRWILLILFQILSTIAMNNTWCNEKRIFILILGLKRLRVTEAVQLPWELTFCFRDKAQIFAPLFEELNVFNQRM